MPQVTYQESERNLVIKVKPTPRKILIFGFLIYAVLFIGCGLICFFVAVKSLTHSLKIAPFTFIFLPIGVILLLYSLQILKRLFEREVITLNCEDLTVTNDLLGLKKTREYPVNKIEHLDLNFKKEYSNHPLSNLPNDYLGFKMRDKESEFILGTKGLKFFYNGYTVYFGKDLNFDDAIEVLIKLKNSIFSN